MTRMRSGPLAVTVAGGLAGAAAGGTWVLATGSARYTTYVGRSSSGLAVALIAGLALAAAGVTLAWSRGWSLAGMAAVLAALAWWAPVWVGWSEGSPTVRSVAGLLGGFVVAMVTHVALAHPRGRFGSRPVAIFVAVVYAEAAVVAGLLAVFREPFADDSCLANCTVNVFLVRSLPSFVAHVITADRWFVAVIAAALGLLCAARLMSASRPSRRRLLPVMAPAIAFAVAAVVRTVRLQSTRVEDPYDGVLFTTFVVTAVSLTLLGAALIGDVVRRRWERRAVARLVVDLDEAPAPGSLQSALAATLGDPDLSIAYWLPESRRWVDAAGFAVEEPEPDPGRRLTRLTQGEATMAVVSHASDRLDLADELGPAVRLGLENERLQADVLAQLEDIRASRARIVESGDAERRRLERDLHDGAQQRLLALSYDVRLALGRVGTSATATAKLTDAVEETMQALAELRELARGIYPAALAEIGFVGALETLADAAPLPVEVTAVATVRWPAAVEAAAYFAVAEAVDDATRRSATYVTVSVEGHEQKLVLVVGDDGALASAAPMMLVDRVVALGGSVVVSPGQCRVEVPCG